MNKPSQKLMKELNARSSKDPGKYKDWRNEQYAEAFGTVIGYLVPFILLYLVFNTL